MDMLPPKRIIAKPRYNQSENVHSTFQINGWKYFMTIVTRINPRKSGFRFTLNYGSLTYFTLYNKLTLISGIKGNAMCENQTLLRMIVLMVSCGFERLTSGTCPTHECLGFST